MFGLWRRFEVVGLLVRDYVLSPTGFGLMPGQVLDLFEAAAGPAEQLFQIKGFLRTAGAHARDLIVYYVGHAGFDNDDYYLGIRTTQRDHEFITTIESCAGRAAKGVSQRTATRCWVSVARLRR